MDSWKWRNNKSLKSNTLLFWAKSPSVQLLFLIYALAASLKVTNGDFLMRSSYVPTGIPLFNPEMPPVIYSLLQILLYSITGCLLYSLFNLTINKYAASLALLVYLSDSQTILVAISSPFWDFITETFVLLQLLITIGFLKQLQISRVWMWRTSFYFMTLILIYAELLFFHQYKNGLDVRLGYTETHNNYLVVIVLIVVVFFSTRIRHTFLLQKRQYLRNLKLLNWLGINEIQFFIFSGLNITFSAILGRFSTSALPLLLLLVSTGIFIRKNKTKQNIYLYLAVSSFTLILLFQGNFFGSNSIPKTFFFISGLLSAPNLLAGRTSSFVAFPIGFSDSGITNFLSLYRSQLSVVQENTLLFAAEIFDHFKESMGFITVGWFDADRFMSGFSLHSLLNLGLRAEFGMLIVFFCAFTILFFIRNPISLLLVGVLLSCMITFSRLETHQWWYLQFFGLWLFAHAISEAPEKFKGLFFSRSYKLNLIVVRPIVILICTIFILAMSNLASSISKEELVSSIDRGTQAQWSKMSPQIKATELGDFTSYAISPGIKSIGITTNHACRYSEMQAKFMRNSLTVSEYRAKLAGKDTIQFPVPVNWYDKVDLQIWTEDASCKYSMKSNSQETEIRHASFASLEDATPLRSKGVVLNPPKSEWININVPSRRSGYKAFSTMFIQEHMDQNPLTVPVGTTAEGYMVENLKSIGLTPLKNKSAIISGELTSGTVVIGIKDFNDNYPSLRTVTPNISNPYFEVCIDLHNARRLELGFISNQYSYSKLRLKINPDIKYVDTCSGKYKNLSTKFGFLRTLH